MNAKRVGMVYLVGAGPGDPSLITIKGKECLSKADLILYDALAHPELLDHCKENATKQFVGKRACKGQQRQAFIDQIMVQEAKKGRTIVRLKGGDPLLFGRGLEEAHALKQHDIPFEIIPGIPSPIAASAYAGISMTHRTLSSSVAYLTATESPEKDKTSHRWDKLATATETLVIFMGMKKIHTIMQLLIQHGRAPHTPVLIIQWASLPTQRVLPGTISTIATKALEAKFGLPSLIIVGDVVKLRKEFRWFDNKPLFGKKVLVIRAKHQAKRFAAMLRKAGASALAAPTIKIQAIRNEKAIRSILPKLHTYSWIIFASQNAVEHFFRVLSKHHLDNRAFGKANICAIGQQTATCLKKHGIFVDLIPNDSRSEGMLKDLKRKLTPKSTILWPRGKESRTLLDKSLPQHPIDSLILYKQDTLDEKEKEDVKASVQQADIICCTSSLSTKRLVDICGKTTLTNKIIASIGPTTSNTIKEYHLSVHVQSSIPSMRSLIDELEIYYKKKR